MKRVLKEYGDKQTTRDKMAKAAKRSLERDGDDSTYHNAINSLTKRGSSREEMQDFQDKFENNESINMKQQVKLSEADFHQVIKGAVERILREYVEYDEDFDDLDDFNEQPVNDIASESRQYKVNESQLQNIIRESVVRILKEAFKSPKLDTMARQHGGVRKNGYGFYGGNDFPIADLTDDMIGDEASQLDTHTGIADNAVNFKDGTSVPIINKEKAMSMQKGFNDVQSQRGRYSTPASHYSKFNVAPTADQRHLQALRKDLGTSNRLKQDPSDAAQRTYKQHWKDFEGDARRQINQAYGQSRGQRNIQNIGN